MTQTPPPAAPVDDDTPYGPPLDERPPYGEPARWPVLLIAAVVLAAIVAAVVLAGVAVRAVWRRMFDDPAPPDEVFMFPDADAPYHGPVYRVWFYDGEYRQLHDRRLSLPLRSLHGAEADAALDRLARELAAEVEARDGQRCFHPRVLLVDSAGRCLRSWSVVT